MPVYQVMLSASDKPAQHIHIRCSSQCLSKVTAAVDTAAADAATTALASTITADAQARDTASATTITPTEAADEGAANAVAATIAHRSRCRRSYRLFRRRYPHCRHLRNRKFRHCRHPIFDRYKNLEMSGLAFRRCRVPTENRKKPTVWFMSNTKILYCQSKPSSDIGFLFAI